MLLNHFDRFLANALKTVIKDELGLRTFKKIEKRIFKKYGITLINALQNFNEIDAVLREDFGRGADKIEKKFIQHIIGYTKGNGKKSWITIYDQNLANLILESFGDPEKKKILEHSFQQPNAIMNLLDSCNIPKTSGYRLTNQLIKNGLLVETDSTVTKEGKRVGKYTSLFDQIKIHMGKKFLSVDVLMNPEFLKTSSVVKLLRPV